MKTHEIKTESGEWVAVVGEVNKGQLVYRDDKGGQFVAKPGHWRNIKTPASKPASRTETEQMPGETN